MLSDSGVAAGVRRIEALTGKAARKSANKQANTLKAVASELKVPPEEMPARIAALLDERRKLERDLSDARKKMAMGGGGGGKAEAASDVRQVNGVKFLARAVSGISPKDLPSLVDEGKKQVGSGLVAIVAVSAEGRAGIAVGVTADLTGALQRRRAGEKRRRSAGRQRRRRPPRHGAGRRPGWLQGGCRAQGDRGRARGLKRRSPAV